MQRRTLLKLAAVAGITANTTVRLRPLFAESASQSTPIHTVLLVTKCHLDVGFTMTQAKVLRKYFDVYFPTAVQTASSLRKQGGDRYTWTTGSWLLYQYLEQASTADSKIMEEAIAAGDINWHALPFSWQTEMVDASMIEGALGFSVALDKRFGHKTIGAKMTDVPGHSRGIIAPLSAAGIRLLNIGVNGASTPPDVPDVFLWKDPAGNSLAMMYHRHDYGSILEIPGAGVAVDVDVRSDNGGPHSPEEIAAIYKNLRARFPGAQIKASHMSEVAAAVDRVREKLPVVTGEIGDTWIYGCPSDPYKITRYRELARQRTRWIAQHKFASGDAVDRKFLSSLLLAPEHTWGTDTKTYLDHVHYPPADLQTVIHEPGYQTMISSWKEKRDDIDDAVASLPDDLKAQASTALATLRPVRPSQQGMQSHELAQPIQTSHFDLAFDAGTGAITRLHNRQTQREWASADSPLALFTYQTLSAKDYDDFLDRYIAVKTEWAPGDFGKPGIAAHNAKSAEWHPRPVACWTSKDAEGDRVVLQLEVHDSDASKTGNVAWPAEIFLKLYLPHAEARIDLEVVTMNKTENRLPEAMWLTFQPAHVSSKGLSLEKVGQPVDPMDVLRGGSRAMHAVSGPIRYHEPQGHSFIVETLDAPVVALGQRSPLNYSTQLPDLSRGIHISLFNNAWGTNYPQWCGGDWSFRFRISA